MISRTIPFAIALLFAFASGPVQAQQPPARMSADDVAKIKVAVTGVVTAYGRYYTERNAKAVVENVFASPSYSVSGGGVTLNDPAKQVAQTEANMKRMAETGWVKSELPNPKVCVLNASAAVASGTYYRYRADGSEHSRGSETFVLGKTANGWRVVTIMFHEAPDKAMTCNE